MTGIVRNIYETASQYHMPFQENWLIWKIIGYTGMTMFFGRFFVQWIHSEIKKESQVTVLFWWQSLIGNDIDAGLFATAT